MTEQPVVVFAIDPSVLADVFPLAVLDRLRRVAVVDPGVALTSFGNQSARRELARADVLITGWGAPAVDPGTLAAAPRLRAVIHAAGSVKAVVHPEVFARGVLVSSAAAANAVPVADYTVSMLVLAAKRTFARARQYADGFFVGHYEPAEDAGLAGCTVGIVGASHIGRLVIDRLRAFDVSILVSDPFLTDTEARALGAERVDLDELCLRADLVSLHAPALPETRLLIDDRRLGLLRDGATLVNTARGSLVDTDALVRHCADGRISAVLDVSTPEPLPPGHPLLTLPNVLVTPHLAGARGRELRAIGEFAAGELERLVRGEPLRGLVRAHDLSRIA